MSVRVRVDFNGPWDTDHTLATLAEEADGPIAPGDHVIAYCCCTDTDMVVVHADDQLIHLTWPPKTPHASA